MLTLLMDSPLALTIRWVHVIDSLDTDLGKTKMRLKITEMCILFSLCLYNLSLLSIILVYYDTIVVQWTVNRQQPPPPDRVAIHTCPWLRDVKTAS